MRLIPSLRCVSAAVAVLWSMFGVPSASAGAPPTADLTPVQVRALLDLQYELQQADLWPMGQYKPEAWVEAAHLYAQSVARAAVGNVGPAEASRNLRARLAAVGPTELLPEFGKIIVAGKQALADGQKPTLEVPQDDVEVLIVFQAVEPWIAGEGPLGVTLDDEIKEVWEAAGEAGARVSAVEGVVQARIEEALRREQQLRRRVGKLDALARQEPWILNWLGLNANEIQQIQALRDRAAAAFVVTEVQVEDARRAVRQVRGEALEKLDADLTVLLKRVKNRFVAERQALADAQAYFALLFQTHAADLPAVGGGAFFRVRLAPFAEAAAPGRSAILEGDLSLCLPRDGGGAGLAAVEEVPLGIHFFALRLQGRRDANGVLSSFVPVRVAAPDGANDIRIDGAVLARALQRLGLPDGIGVRGVDVRRVELDPPRLAVTATLVPPDASALVGGGKALPPVRFSIDLGPDKIALRPDGLSAAVTRGADGLQQSFEKFVNAALAREPAGGVIRSVSPAEGAKWSDGRFLYKVAAQSPAFGVVAAAKWDVLAGLERDAGGRLRFVVKPGPPAPAFLSAVRDGLLAELDLAARLPSPDPQKAAEYLGRYFTIEDVAWDPATRGVRLTARAQVDVKGPQPLTLTAVARLGDGSLAVESFETNAATLQEALTTFLQAELDRLSRRADAALAEALKGQSVPLGPLALVVDDVTTPDGEVRFALDVRDGTTTLARLAPLTLITPRPTLEGGLKPGDVDFSRAKLDSGKLQAVAGRLLGAGPQWLAVDQARALPDGVALRLRLRVPAWGIDVPLGEAGLTLDGVAGNFDADALKAAVAAKLADFVRDNGRLLDALGPLRDVKVTVEPQADSKLFGLRCDLKAKLKLPAPLQRGQRSSDSETAPRPEHPRGRRRVPGARARRALAGVARHRPVGRAFQERLGPHQPSLRRQVRRRVQGLGRPYALRQQPARHHRRRRDARQDRRQHPRRVPRRRDRPLPGQPRRRVGSPRRSRNRPDRRPVRVQRRHRRRRQDSLARRRDPRREGRRLAGGDDGGPSRARAGAAFNGNHESLRRQGGAVGDAEPDDRPARKGLQLHWEYVRRRQQGTGGAGDGDRDFRPQARHDRRGVGHSGQDRPRRGGFRPAHRPRGRRGRRLVPPARLAG